MTKAEMVPKVADELLKCWTPVQSTLPEYQFLSTPWEHENKDLIELTHAVARNATKKDYPDLEEIDPEFIHEVAWTGAGILDGVATWSTLNSGGGCALISHELEAAVVNKAFTTPKALGIDTFSAVASSRVPNLGSMSWERVLELRHHPHVEHFRRKMSAIEAEVCSGSTQHVVDLISEIELSDLQKLAKSVEPSTKTAVVKAIASNFPLPVPINPASIVFSAKDVAQNMERQKVYGWLYFLMDLSDRSE